MPKKSDSTKETVNEDTGVKMTEPDVSVPAQDDDDQLMMTKGQVRAKLKKDYLGGSYNYVQLAKKYDLTLEQVEDVLLTPEELAKQRSKAPEFIPGRDG